MHRACEEKDQTLKNIRTLHSLDTRFECALCLVIPLRRVSFLDARDCTLQENPLRAPNK